MDGNNPVCLQEAFVLTITTQADSSASTSSTRTEENIPSSPSVSKETDEAEATSAFGFPQTRTEDVPFESSVFDAQDAEKIYAMYADDSPDCCKNKCNKLIPKHIAVKHRHKFMELDNNEQDLVILTTIQAFLRLHELDSVYATQNTKQKFRSNQNNGFKLNVMKYTFLSLHVCKGLFFFIHPVGTDRYKSLLRHYDIHGLLPRTHKSTGKAASRENALSMNDIETVMNFIRNYANEYGSLLSGRISSCKKFEKAIRLPSTDTKSAVYRKYCVAVEATPEIRKENFLPIQHAVNTDDDNAEKTAALANAMARIEKAKLQRDHYNKWRTKAKNETGVEDCV